MQLDITGRHIEITPALREFTEEKLSKLERLLDGPLEVHVVLAIEKHRHYAEVQVKSRSAVFTGTQETGDLYASIGDVADKLERQALKHKEKMRNHKHVRGPRSPEIAATIEAHSTAAVSGAGEEETSDAAPRIFRDQSYRVKPLSPEDAVLELESTGRSLLVFRNADNDRVHVVYRNSEGDYGLIEPEF